MHSLGYMSFLSLLISGFIAASNLYIPYYLVTTIVMMLILFISRFIFIRWMTSQKQGAYVSDFPLWRQIPFVFGLISIFSM